MATCVAPRLFRHRQTHQYWIATCQRWQCTACIHKVAKRWRAIVNWASQHGPAPLFFLTLTLRDPLPLWRQASADQQAGMQKHAQDLAGWLPAP